MIAVARFFVMTNRYDNAIFSQILEYERFLRDVHNQTSIANQALHHVSPKSQKRKSSVAVEKGRTKNPTAKSAHANETINKFVVERKCLLRMTARMTIKLPDNVTKFKIPFRREKFYFSGFPVDRIVD
uniref:Uncharacterized protein n=1 Tax=Romanomermis culicivorax TaxID=13658 RepID=A0A915KH09_ROMCU